jgi:hypothetical protein
MFPDEGELFQAEQKKSETLIFFAHHFQGHKKTLRRHIEFVNELGFDAYAFNLKDSPKDHYFVPYSHISKKFGMKHALADQIEDHFKLMSAYDSKIIFGFSNVTGCCIEFAARHFSDGFTDIKAMICDSGPGQNFIYSAFQLLEYQMGIKSLPLKILGTPFVALGWTPALHKDIQADLKKFPRNFPLLSIRGWKDPMISPKHIDDIFDSVPALKWQKCGLPQAGHLNGLRDFPSEYKPAVENFLKNI